MCVPIYKNLLEKGDKKKHIYPQRHVVEQLLLTTEDFRQKLITNQSLERLSERAAASMALV